MTHKDMQDIFAPGTEVTICYITGELQKVTLIGWREQGIVVKSEGVHAFIPFTSLRFMQETSHA